MPDQSCLALVLGGPQHCSRLSPREVVQGGGYDGCLAGSTWHRPSASALRIGEISQLTRRIMLRTEEHPAATAVDILAAGPDTPGVDPRWQKYFDRLNRLREYIAQQRS